MTDKYIWKDIKELDSLYKINSNGKIIRMRRQVKSPSHIKGYFIIKQQEKKPQDNGKGYQQLYVQINKKRKMFYVHRLVAKYFIPNPANLPEVNHINGDKSDNRAENLEWCSKSYNIRHGYSTGLFPKGENSKNSKLNKNQVLAIRRLHRMNKNFNKMQVARKMGVRDTTIHKIIKYQRWKHLELTP